MLMKQLHIKRDTESMFIIYLFQLYRLLSRYVKNETKLQDVIFIYFTNSIVYRFSYPELLRRKLEAPQLKTPCLLSEIHQ